MHHSWPICQPYGIVHSVSAALLSPQGPTERWKHTTHKEKVAAEGCTHWIVVGCAVRLTLFRKTAHQRAKPCLVPPEGVLPCCGSWPCHPHGSNATFPNPCQCSCSLRTSRRCCPALPHPPPSVPPPSRPPSPPGRPPAPPWRSASGRRRADAAAGGPWAGGRGRAWR